MKHWDGIDVTLSERHPPNDETVPSVGERAVAAVFGLFFGGIGLAILGGIVSTLDAEWPPLFFRVVGALMAMPPLAIGAMALFAAITGKPSTTLSGKAGGRVRRRLDELRRVTGDAGHAKGMNRLTCPQCAAPLTSGADVSPSGDVKCGHCNSWFNVHQSG